MVRRGVDTDLFHPGKRDPDWLRTRLGLPEGRRVAVFAGRADGSKRVLVAAEATRLLLDRGHDLALVVAGAGGDLPRAQALCGDRLIAPGVLSQADLARLFASADLLVFPSESEIVGNVVLEALACGLPAVLSGRKGGTARLIHRPGAAGVAVHEGTADAWAAAMAGMLGGDRAAQGTAARAGVEAATPTWPTVFHEDLAEPWRALVAADRARRGAATG
nr:glycosyltransferase [Roseospira visakhapatnamensis]